MRKNAKFIILFLILQLATLIIGSDFKTPIVLPADHNHDKWNTQPKDIVRYYEAYTVSFDGPDDSNGDGIIDEQDKVGEPEWVAYQINMIGHLPKGPNRPSVWMTDKALAKQGIAPSDNTYANSGYDRGHMCMKEIAWRLGENADWNTHNMLNACPQIHEFNAGIWLNLEELTQRWADKYGKVWVICGPIFMKGQPRRYIGDPGEKKIPIPDAFFKIVIREKSNGRIDALAFVYKHEAISKGPDGKYNHNAYLVNIRYIEKLTGLDFLTALPESEQDIVESLKHNQIWD